MGFANFFAPMRGLQRALVETHAQRTEHSNLSKLAVCRPPQLVARPRPPSPNVGAVLDQEASGTAHNKSCIEQSLTMAAPLSWAAYSCRSIRSAISRHCRARSIHVRASDDDGARLASSAHSSAFRRQCSACGDGIALQRRDIHAVPRTAVYLYFKNRNQRSSLKTCARCRACRPPYNDESSDVTSASRPTIQIIIRMPRWWRKFPK